MELMLDRKWKKDTYTIGRLYIDGVLFCNTIEDKDRGLTQDMPLEEIKKKKVYGETAIPTGRYKVSMIVQSPKYAKSKKYEKCKGYIPRLVNVPGYDGILIHIGNYAKDSYGCILVGENTKKGAVMKSTEWFWRLYTLLKMADERGEDIWITIK